MTEQKKPDAPKPHSAPESTKKGLNEGFGVSPPAGVAKPPPPPPPPPKAKK